MLNIELLAKGICVPLRTPTAAPKSGSRESGLRRRRSFLAVRWRLIRRTAVSAGRVSSAKLAGRPGRPALPVRGRGMAGSVASGRGGAIVPVAGATTVLPLLSSLRMKLSPAGDARAWCYPRKTNA